MDEKLIHYLENFVSARRQKLINQVLNQRTRYLTVVLEDIYQAQNASAVLRSCECFGIQDVHIIENENEYSVNPDVVKGATKWLDLYKYDSKPNNTLATINHLKKQGYRIVATSPHVKGSDLQDFDIGKRKMAVLFGSEKGGLSEFAIQNSDEFLKIPMRGFTESLNISVSAAIVLQILSGRIRTENVKWHLTDQEKIEIKISWLKKSIKSAELIIDKYFEKLSKFDR